MIRPLLSALLVLALAAPAEAAQVLLKDGHVVTGRIAVDGPGLAVTGDDGKTERYPYTAIQAVSLDDQPVLAPRHDLAASKFFDSDVLLWSVVGANVATMVLAAIAIYRTANPTPAR